MAGVKILARFLLDSGMPVERLLCHPQLPLVAALDGERPAVHVFDCERHELHPLGSIGAHAAAYGEIDWWTRMLRDPFVAWNPVAPLLLAAIEGTVWYWSSAGVGELTGLPPDAAYSELMFSPDGRTLWASPSSTDPGRTDAIDRTTGRVAIVDWYPWGAAHPAGVVVSTLMQNQGASHALFVRVDRARPADRHLQRESIILDADGYLPAVFSPDGRYFAIRGNAYRETLHVHAFPSLQQVLYDEFEDGEWWRNDIVFGAKPGMLWIGTPTGALRSYDLAHDAAETEHGVLADAPITAMGATSLGHLVIGCRNGEILLVSVPGGAAADHPVDTLAMRAGVVAYLAGTEDVPDGVGNLESYLIITDGDRTWAPEDLETVTDATTSDPSWLQLRAMYNRLFQDGPPEFRAPPEP
jgi:hypothetical protein